MQKCLIREPKSRITIPQLLSHSFLASNNASSSVPNGSITLTFNEMREIVIKLAVSKDLKYKDPNDIVKVFFY
jgi:serine/threonine protein kinase